MCVCLSRFKKYLTYPVCAYKIDFEFTDFLYKYVYFYIGKIQICSLIRIPIYSVLVEITVKSLYIATMVL